ncbi:hypothetical protein [Inquilinus limosus]|uniref:Uncharacterized protein n=1 Tax=Inquilinus limosus MP06 TaxID=1398085 RepID=A0A0A0D2V7_9PROT|nr:hypothetical protein [Inquilinus limosus]KGM33061.1 hypothetical protein P409_17880 [Inquilinus limosus MP06]
MNLAFLSCFDRRLRLALGAVISPRAEALAALPRFRNRDLRHDPVRDEDKVLLRWIRDAETSKLVARWDEPAAAEPVQPAAPVDDLAEHRARRAQRYRSRFVWTDRRSA